jgi:hypothetical protein
MAALNGGLTNWPCISHRVTSPYGVRNGKKHDGVDISPNPPKSEPVFAMGAGKVTTNSYNTLSGYFVRITHDGRLATTYRHLKAKSPVKVGTKVVAGQKIGDTGKTGSATGIHLHIELWRNGSVIDVTPYLNAFGGKDVIIDTSAKNGWLKESGSWYYYKAGVKQTGWLKDNDYWYYLSASGTMQTGWVKDNGQWYYLDPANDSGKMLTGWLDDKGKLYYLHYNGAMLTGDHAIQCTFDSSGALIK